MNMQWIYWSLRSWIVNSPWGALFFVIIVFLFGGVVLGAVDFRKKEQLVEPDDDQEPADKLARLQSIQDFLQTKVEGNFRVDHFDGAFQVFTTPDLPLSNEELYQKLRLRFPNLVCAIHRSLQAETQSTNE